MTEASAPNGAQETRQTFQYFGWLTLFVFLATPASYLIDIQTTFLLKNQLHATASDVSLFRLLTGVPVYFAFAFGLMRDQWNPLGMRDRGFFLIFAPATAAVFFWMGASKFTYAGLLAGILAAMLCSRFVVAAYQGLMALVGQERLMSGRLSALWNIVSSIPIVGGAFASGYISDHLSPRQAFLLAGGFAIVIALFGFWKPASIFRHAYDKPQAATADFVSNVKRLARHRAVYPAVLICFLWNFAPGAATPLQFYLSDRLHASDAIYSYYNGIFAISFIPTFLLYAALCKKVPLNKLLWWGTVVAVPQLIPMAFIHSGKMALVLAVPIGLMGGVATAAYFDLAMRSCPPGMQGTLMMMVDGVLALSARGGDLLGAKIYNSSPEHGFAWCVAATTAVYASILLVILMVPKHLTATADGQANPAAEAELLKEIGEDGRS